MRKAPRGLTREQVAGLVVWMLAALAAASQSVDLREVGLAAVDAAAGRVTITITASSADGAVTGARTVAIGTPAIGTAAGH